jgi:hypothetical protein
MAQTVQFLNTCFVSDAPSGSKDEDLSSRQRVDKSSNAGASFEETLPGLYDYKVVLISK